MRTKKLLSGQLIRKTEAACGAYENLQQEEIKQINGIVLTGGTGPVITREYTSEWEPGDEPYYPINDEKNNALFRRYRYLADQQSQLLIGGRLGLYRYYDMDQVVSAALDMTAKELKECRL